MSLLHANPILFQINADDFGTGWLGWVGWTGGDGAVLILFATGLYPGSKGSLHRAFHGIWGGGGQTGWLAGPNILHLHIKPIPVYEL